MKHRSLVSRPLDSLTLSIFCSVQHCLPPSLPLSLSLFSLSFLPLLSLSVVGILESSSSFVARPHDFFQFSSSSSCPPHSLSPLPLSLVLSRSLSFSLSLAFSSFALVLYSLRSRARLLACLLSQSNRVRFVRRKLQSAAAHAHCPFLRPNRHSAHAPFLRFNKHSVNAPTSRQFARRVLTSSKFKAELFLNFFETRSLICMKSICQQGPLFKKINFIFPGH